MVTQHEAHPQLQVKYGWQPSASALHAADAAVADSLRMQVRRSLSSCIGTSHGSHGACEFSLLPTYAPVQGPLLSQRPLKMSHLAQRCSRPAWRSSGSSRSCSWRASAGQSLRYSRAMAGRRRLRRQQRRRRQHRGGSAPADPRLLWMQKLTLQVALLRPFKKII